MVATRCVKCLTDVLKGSLVQRTAFEDIALNCQSLQLHLFLHLVCTEDVCHYGCYLQTQNLDIYLLQLCSFLIFSHLISTLIFPLLSASMTCVCALIPSSFLALNAGSGGCFGCLSFLWSAFVLFLL